MDEKIKTLNEKKKEIDKEIQKIWEEECNKLAIEIKKNKIDEEGALSRLSEYVKNTEEIENILRMFIRIANTQGLNLKKIKANLAERICINAKGKFLDVPQDDLSEALNLFKEIGDEAKIKECKQLFNNLLELSESIKIE